MFHQKQSTVLSVKSQFDGKISPGPCRHLTQFLLKLQLIYHYEYGLQQNTKPY